MRKLFYIGLVSLSLLVNQVSAWGEICAWLRIGDVGYVGRVIVKTAAGSVYKEGPYVGVPTKSCVDIHEIHSGTLMHIWVDAFWGDTVECKNSPMTQSRGNNTYYLWPKGTVRNVQCEVMPTYLK